MYVYSPEEELQICEMYREGYSSTMVAQKYFICPHTVTNILRRHGYQVRRSGKQYDKFSGLMYEDRNKQIVSMRAAGRPYLEIATKFNIDIQSCRKVVWRSKVKAEGEWS